MFWSLALVIGLAAVAVWIRFVVAYAEGNGKGHVQSLILGAVLFIAAVVLWALGRDRRPAGGPAGDDPAHASSGCAGSSCELGVAPSHYEPGAAAAAAPRCAAGAGRRAAREAVRL